MTQDQVLLIVLVVLVVANVFLVATMPLRMRGRQPAIGRAGVEPRSIDPSAGRADPGVADDARIVAAIETFVAGVSADNTGQPPPLAISDAMAGSPQWTLAELGDSAMWSRTIREESARAARFGHPVTVVMAELPT